MVVGATVIAVNDGSVVTVVLAVVATVVVATVTTVNDVSVATVVLAVGATG